MGSLKRILDRAGIAEPDGRPLHRYDCSDAEIDDVGKELADLLRRCRPTPELPAAFALWGAEEIRRSYASGHLTWSLITASVGDLEETRARDLVRAGLPWWRRRVRVHAGRTLYLHSLMAEGGLPDKLFAGGGSFCRVVLALVAELEREVSPDAELATILARRHSERLPAVFREEGAAALLGDLAAAIVMLRRALPTDLPDGGGERWLERNRPGWRDELPLRLSADAVNALVRPALETATEALPSSGPIGERSLRRGIDGVYCGALAFSSEAFLPAELLGADANPSARLRLQPSGRELTRVSYLATPEEGGWKLLKVGRGTEVLQFPIDSPLVFIAYADGHSVGAVCLEEAIPSPNEEPTLWRNADNADGDTPAALVPTLGRTTRPRLWLLAARGMEIETEGTVAIGPALPAHDGALLSVSGSGAVRVGTARLRIETGASSDAEARGLVLSGRVLPRWRAEKGVPVFLGRPDAWGSGEAGTYRLLRRGVTFDAPDTYGASVARWRIDGREVARARYVELPQGSSINVSEVEPRHVSLAASGLPAGWQVTLNVDQDGERAVVSGEGSVRLSLVARLPGPLRLTIADPRAGLRISLSGAWPSRRALVIDPDGELVTSPRHVSADGLAGWCALLPRGGGVVELGTPAPLVRIEIAGEISLAAWQPLVRNIFSLAGADANVAIHVVANGDAGPRITVGRYDFVARLRGDVLPLPQKETALHALSLTGPLQTRTLTANGDTDLRPLLGDQSETWFIQGRSMRAVMRPVAWPPGGDRRADRIRAYAKDWRDMLDDPASPRWSIVAQKIAAARAGGDAGGLDEVQALGRVPAAAVALMLRARAVELPAWLGLETEAPIWWPLVTISDVARGVRHALERKIAQFEKVGDPPDTWAYQANLSVAEQAHKVVVVRPELRGHFASGFEAAGLQPFAFVDGEPRWFNRVDDPAGQLAEAAQAAARRAPHQPAENVLIPVRGPRQLPQNTVQRPLLDAPLAVADIACGLVAQPDHRLATHLLALRWADQEWFDTALPLAIAQRSLANV